MKKIKSTLKKSWTVTVQEDLDNPDELIMPFPEDMLDQVGWVVGDTLVWNVLASGEITISKKVETST